MIRFTPRVSFSYYLQREKWRRELKQAEHLRCARQCAKGYAQVVLMYLSLCGYWVGVTNLQTKNLSIQDLKPALDASKVLVFLIQEKLKSERLSTLTP